MENETYKSKTFGENCGELQKNVGVKIIYQEKWKKYLFI